MGAAGRPGVAAQPEAVPDHPGRSSRISPAVLSGRLDQLAADGVLVHHPTLRYYELTPLGHGLRPVLLELGRWGLAHPGHDPSRFISPTSLMLSMSIMIHPERAGRRRDTVGFDLGSECFSARLDGRGGFVVAATASAEGGVVLGGTGNELAAVVYGPTPVADHVAAGTVRVEGSVAAAQSFVELFSLHHDPAALTLRQPQRTSTNRNERATNGDEPPPLARIAEVAAASIRMEP
ncbi:MAG: hypothetical protein R2705_01570 [Ilumatobacteraceae bacterium]